MLAYGTAADMLDEYLKVAETTGVLGKLCARGGGDIWW
jgi:hypothetical protein